MSAPDGVPMFVLTQRDDDASAVDAALRDVGIAVHCIRVERAEDVEARIEDTPADLMLVFTDQPGVDLGYACDVTSRANSRMPVIAVRHELDEKSIEEALRSGASDAITLDARERFQSVIARELRAVRLERALDDVLGSASQYRNQLKSLMQGAAEAICVVQEGIIVDSNPAWSDLFGLEGADACLSTPVMDLFAGDDQQALKGAIVACLNGRWNKDELRVCAARNDGVEVRLEMALENIVHDDEPAVRLVVSARNEDTADDPELAVSASRLDPLTGMTDRRGFLDTLAGRLEEPLKGGVRALVVVRPDRFSGVRETVGLLGTDAVIQDLGLLITDTAQPSDICARIGGTVFAILVERGTMCDVESWAAHLLKTIGEKLFEHEGRSTTLTCTIGLDEAETSGCNPIELLEQTDAACQQGRLAGGNRVEFSVATSESRRIRVADAAWIPRIRSAMMQDRLQLNHQPVASLLDEQDGMFDTFVRLIDEEGNTVLPSEFLPAAERSGLIKNVDRWVVGASLDYCVESDPSLLFVRLSRESVLDSEFLKWLDSRVSETGARSGQICFQVPESTVLTHIAQVKSFATALIERGYSFAVEHAGRTQDTSQVLTHIPMQFVKIDGSLMQGLARDTDIQNRVSGLTKEAKELGISAIAERVEDANTMAVLWQLGIAYIQGNYVEMTNVVLEDDTPELSIVPDPPLVAEQAG